MWLKLETQQPTGSFKVRGALAALTQAGGGPVVTASAGNAGLGVAWAASALGVPATIVVPESASPAKVAALRALPVELVMHGAGYDEAEAHALSLPGHLRLRLQRHARRRGRRDDRAGARGARRAAHRGLRDRRRRARLRASGSGPPARPGTRVVAVEAERSPAFSTALAAGALTEVEVGETLADGLAGNIEPGSVTFPLVRDHVAAVAGVDEPQIEDGIRFLARAHGLVAEGAGAVPAAALLRGRGRAGGGGDRAGRLRAQHRAGPVGGGAGTNTGRVGRRVDRCGRARFRLCRT